MTTNTTFLVPSAILLALLSVAATDAAEWEPVTAQLIQTEKPGYGKLSGVVVDQKNGDVYVNLSDRGMARSLLLRGGARSNTRFRGQT